MMTYLKHFLRFWYDFIVGDDWMIAAGVVMALVLSAALARRGLNAWWVMLVTVVVMLAASLWRETRRSRYCNSAQRVANFIPLAHAGGVRRGRRRRSQGVRTIAAENRFIDRRILSLIVPCADLRTWTAKMSFPNSMKLASKSLLRQRLTQLVPWLNHERMLRWCTGGGPAPSQGPCDRRSTASRRSMTAFTTENSPASCSSPLARRSTTRRSRHSGRKVPSLVRGTWRCGTITRSLPAIRCGSRSSSSIIGSATQVMLTIQVRATVGQKYPPEGGQWQPWSSEILAQRVDRAGTRKMVIPAMANKIITVERADVSLWPAPKTASLLTSNAR
jgi:hypothetical protein